MANSKQPLLTLYHGTSLVRAELILLYGWAYKPVYVTTDMERAWHYAQARTAWDMQELGAVDREGCRPALVQMRTRLWERDTYSDGEPDQYKVSSHRRNAIGIHNYPGEWPAEPNELVRLRAYAVTMGWGEDRQLTRVGKTLGGESEDY